jgi:hypothetical protein
MTVHKEVIRGFFLGVECEFEIKNVIDDTLKMTVTVTTVMPHVESFLDSSGQICLGVWAPPIGIE